MTTMATQHTRVNTTTGADTGVLKGEWGFIRNTMDWAEEAEEVLAQILEDHRIKSRDEIREIASQDPDWSDLADVIDVEVTSDGFGYVFKGTPDEVERAMELEYGGPDRNPTGLLRKHSIQQAKEADLTMEAPLA